MALVPSIPGLEIRRVFPGEDEFAAARRLHAECYLATGYVTDDDLDGRGWLTDMWVEVSDYFAAIETETDEVVGTARLIRPSVRGFPAFIETGIDPEAIEVFADLDPNRCVEVSALATPRTGIQNMAISAALYGAVWQESLRTDRAYMIAVMDNRFLRLMRRWFHAPFEAIGNSMHYMGSRSTPVAMYTPRTIEHLRDNHPDSLAFFSGDITLAEMEELVVDLRETTPEFRAKVIDLTEARAADEEQVGTT